MKSNSMKLFNKFIRRGSGANLNLFRYAAMVVVLLTLGIGNAWATTYYANLTISKTGETGKGKVYYATSNSKPSSETSGALKSAGSTTQNANQTYYWWVDVDPGYNVTLSGKITAGPATAATLSGNVACAQSSSSGSGTSYTATANIVAVTVNSVSPASKDLAPTNPSIDYPFTVTFATSNLKTIALDLNKSPETADGKFTITNWSLDGTNVVANGKFNGSGSYGGASRNHSTTVSLQSKASGSAAKTCTVTANFPALAFTGADVMDVYTTTGDATKTGTAEFNFNYGAEDDFPATPSFTHTSGSGAFTVTGYTVTPDFSKGTCKVTVNYSFNPNGVAGTTKEELKITSVGGLVATATVTGESEAEATDDVSVTTAAGVTTNYATWAAGLAAANASSGCTLTLLRDIDLTETYGITSTQGITQTFTLDLNGKTLSASILGSILNPKTSGKTLTIKDSKTGGKIENIAYRNDIVYGINVGAGVTLNIEGGYIYAENTAQYAYGTSTYTDGTPNLTSMQTRAINMAATSTVNISGGKVHAVATRNARAIHQESSKANNTVLNITGGEVLGEAPCYAYGIYAAGKVNISGGSVNALLNDKTVDGNTTYTANAWNDYTLHRYGYAIMMVAVSNATQANNYFGTLKITGGTINSTNVNKTLNSSSAVQTEHTYGIYLNVSATGAGAGKTGPDGTKVMKACAIGSMENATININHAGSTAYGVMAVGCYNSFDNTTTPFTIKNSTINVNAFAAAYGVYANAYVNWSSTLTALTGNGGCTYGNIELTNTTINATTTGGAGAYCGWAGCTSGTVANAKATTGSTSTGNGTYYGEYAAAGKITVNNGTYTASAATSSAYGFGSSDRAKCVRNVNGVFSGRDAATDPQGSLSDNTPTSEAYPELYIHGGDISATTGTSTTAIAIKSGGNTVIDGGTFNAYSGAGTAYGLYVTAGKTTANGVTFPASATTKAYGVYVTGAVSDWSLFTYYGEVELNNCNASGTARTATDARGVFVEGNTKVYTQASFDAMKSANNSNYKNYGDYAQVGERAFVGKATINGGTYTATAETSTAYGIVVTSTRVTTNKEAIAYSPLTVKNATITAKTNTGTTAYGVQPGAGGVIENCTITATAGTTTASGVRAIDKTTIIKNSTITAKGTDAVYGLEGYVDVSTTHGNCWHGDFDLTEAGSTKVTAESTGSTKAYTIYLNAKAASVASGTFAGDYATAANATINEGEYIAKTNGGTSGYTIALTGKQTKGDASAQPEVLINGGKFNGATAEVGTAGVIGHVQMKGGYYVHSTNLATYIPEGYEAFPLPEDRPEYTAGYRYAIEKAGNHGVYVCQIGSTKYKSLEEALQVVGNNQVIYMIANYTMTTPGDYILPSGATLLIPYKTGSGAGATTAIGNSAKTTTSATTPTLFRKLTFGPGVNLTCSGTIETSAEQKANGQYGANVGMASGAYGQIHLEEGSHISIENGARLNCWGFITGKGTIEVKNGGKILEGFQMADWCGGTNYNNVFKSASTANYVFPITHYFYQSIECPITYRPGCRAYGSTHVNVTLAGTVGQDDVPLVGTSGSMFIMDDNDVSKETWVMKDYDEETDQCIWTINSGASIGNLTISISGYNMKSASYDLPITTNMSIVLNYGEMAIGQNTVMLPGSQLIVNKQGTAVINGVTVVAYDAEDWTGSSRYFATYSPTWGTSSPRKNIPVADAEMFLHGKVNIKGNGGLYTTPSGANIHSTNEDAGEVIYTTAATGNKTSYYLNQGGTTRPSLTVNPAKLKNGDGSYASSAGTASGKTWTYKNDVWDAWSKDGCFLMDAQDKPHAKPAELVELTSKTPDANHLHHDAATGARNFVWDENCYWWEVVTTPTPEGYYQSLNPDNNGKYNYYYYDSAADCWKIKTITVTWSINGANTNYTVGYGTKPHWLGATPTKTSSSSDYVWRWDGWTLGSDPTVYENEELPVVTANTTFTAHFYEKYYQSLVTFKNDDGTVLDSRLWNRGTTPSYEGTPTKEATAAQTFEFNGNWSPTITAVGSSSVEYVAQYTPTTRQYNVEFVNYDMSPLGSILVDYNATPTTATYKAAIAPSDFDPYKPDNNAYSFEFAGWSLNGAEENGFAQVKGDQTYVAQFAETTKKYRITFLDEDGETVLHWTQLEYDAMPSYDGPATSGFDKQDAEWDYVFTGWTPATFTQVKGPQTYTANYSTSKRSYTITWVDGDGNTLTTTNVEYGTTPSYPGTPTPTKASTNTHSYQFNNTWSPALAPVTGEATYTALFNEAPRSYSVTLNTNEGTINAGNVTSYTYGTGVTLPTNVTRTGYDFNGWYDNSGLTGSAVENISSTAIGNKTYWAKWTIHTHALAWNFNGGTPSGSYTAAGNAIAYGTAITYPTLSKTGYTFSGWSTSVTSMPDEDLTIAATWTPSTNTPYVVKHYKEKLEGGYNAEPDETDNLTGTTATEVTPAVRNYTGFTAPEAQTVTILADGSRVVEYYYLRKSNKVTWNATENGGSCATEYTMVKTGATIGTLPEATKTGHDFQGWFTTISGGGNQVTAATMITNKITFYARFTPQTYDITYKDQGNEEFSGVHGAGYPTTHTYGTATALVNPTKGGYTFNGWYDNAGCTGAALTEIGAAAYTDDFTLYAKWTASICTITWRNYNEDFLGTSTIQPGGTPGYSTVQHGVPTRDAAGGKIYEWDGWTTEPNGAGTFYAKDELPAAAGDATYYAHFRIKSIEVEASDDIDIDEDTNVETTIVHVQGALNVAPSATLTTQDLILEATPGTSGEIIGTVEATEHAYFDLSNGAEGFKARTWYAVAVPWQVAVPAYDIPHCGVYITNDGEHYTQQELGSSFDLIYYDGALRAAQGPVNDCWRFVEDDASDVHIMYPGRAYMIYLTSDAQTIRFERKSDADLQTTTLAVDTWGTGNAKDMNWNGIANPATYHAYINANAGTYQGTANAGQIYHAESRSYSVVDLSQYDLVVGQPVFVQATAKNQSVAAISSHNVSAPYYAPRRSGNWTAPVTRYTVSLAADEAEASDRVIVCMDEDKEQDTYVIGQDLMKMGVSSVIPQLYINRYDGQMCVNTAAPVNNQTDYPLGIYVPQAGEYNLFINDQPNDETMLYLTLDGEIIWNLSYGGYVVNLDKGTTNRFGLRMIASAPQVTTGVEEALINAQGETRKVLINDKVFIIRGDNVYSADGQLVK